MTPYYSDGRIRIYHGDCREVLPALAAFPFDALVTDPPYPNKAGHFDDAVDIARRVLAEHIASEAIVFWDEFEVPPVPLPLVARHVWHRNNTNRPDNYEAIYEFRRDGKRRASRVMAYPVVYPGLTGCVEATGHPTQKNEKLMRELVQRTEGAVLDPFMGSGSTLRAAKDLGREAVGIEVDERWCEIAARRLGQEVLAI